MDMPEDLPQYMFFSDEKYFLVHQPHNRKNTGTWASENPNIIQGVKNQAAKKALCFVAIIDGKVLKPIWIDKDPVTKKCSVDSKVYKKILIKIINQFTPEQLATYWWQQDGATGKLPFYQYQLQTLQFACTGVPTQACKYIVIVGVSKMAIFLF